MDVLAAATLAATDADPDVMVSRRAVRGAKTFNWPERTKLTSFLPLQGDDLTILVLKMQWGLADLEDPCEDLRVRLTELMKRTDPGMYEGLVEQGDVQPLEGDHVDEA